MEPANTQFQIDEPTIWNWVVPGLSGTLSVTYLSVNAICSNDIVWQWLLDGSTTDKVPQKLCTSASTCIPIDF